MNHADDIGWPKTLFCVFIIFFLNPIWENGPRTFKAKSKRLLEKALVEDSIAIQTAPWKKTEMNWIEPVIKRSWAILDLKNDIDAARSGRSDFANEYLAQLRSCAKGRKTNSQGPIWQGVFYCPRSRAKLYQVKVKT